jgi:Zn-dependent protease with chaperone function
LADVRVGDRIGRAQRVIYLANAGELHSENQAAADALARRLGQGGLGLRVFRLESRYSLAVLALLFSLAAGWVGVRFGVPVLARYAVHFVPASLEAQLGAQGLAALDDLVFKPSHVPVARQEQLRQRLRALCQKAGDCSPWQLEFRDGRSMGANALALPGGTLVMTDALIRLAKHDDELMAVAAHELGHVRQRHGLRQALAGAGSVLLLEVMLGDVGGIADLSGGIPALLLHTGYTRDMEEEADAQALKFMQRTCLPAQRFADIMERLDPASKTPKAQRMEGAFALFSTHPQTLERIKAFQRRELVTSGC